MEFQSTDPNFSVSWLLGLKPYPTRPLWAGLYETKERHFRVSRILGLIPSKKPRRPRRRTKKTRDRPSQEEDTDVDPFGLRRLFDDLDIDAEEKSKGTTETKPAEGETVEPPVLVDVGFLELCKRLALLIDDIERERNETDDDKESIDGLSPEDCEDESSHRKEWLRQKTVEKSDNKYLDRVMSLPGLEDAKEFFLLTKARIMANERRGISDFKKENFDVAFMGNQGTGKTMLAHLYAKFLRSMGVVKQVGTITGINYFSAYNVSKTATIGTIQSTCLTCGGCIAVIDHAHLFDNDDANLWNLFARTRDIPGVVVLVLAGNRDWGLANQLNYSAQVANHFTVVKTPNYNQEELRLIFHAMMRQWGKGKLFVEGGFDGLYVKVLIRRLTAGSSEKSFGNAWAVRKAFLDAHRRQLERIILARKSGEYVADWWMTKEDLLGNKPSLEADKSDAWKELQTLIGLGNTKDSILALVNQVKQNHVREMRGDEPLHATPNRVFLGPPGTGKTTVAKLYGKVLADLGILSKGDVIVKNPSDLIDRYIGGSEANTKEALRDAQGNVLIIDDAHMLDPGQSSSGTTKNGDFRGAVIDTIVAEVTGAPGEDRCIILCGYPEQMKEMYANCNPGLSRRFPLESAFVFENFSEEELGKILDLKLEKEKLKTTPKAREVAMEALKRASVRPNFGNGGEVVNLIAKAAIARTQRLVKDPKLGIDDLDEVPLEPEDFDPDHDRLSRAVTNTRALFEGFVGFEEIISKFESYQLMVQGMRLRGIDPRPYVPFTYVFKGPPGTGKTTTARKLGQIFYDMGFLSAPEVIEASASQLIGEYCGQTGPKTRRLLESALGKVLFIDEAYRLDGGGGKAGAFAQEAIGELVDAVTKPQFNRKLIVVLAGYEEEMDRLLRSNQGMRSRFATEFTFRPLRVEQCLEQLRKVVNKVGITIQQTPEMDGVTRRQLTQLLTRLSSDKGWASGRSVETLGEQLIQHVFKECALKGYTGKDLVVPGRDLLMILGRSSGLPVGMSTWGGQGPLGSGQVMTLRDLEKSD